MADKMVPSTPTFCSTVYTFYLDEISDKCMYFNRADYMGYFLPTVIASTVF